MLARRVKRAPCFEDQYYGCRGVRGAERSCAKDFLACKRMGTCGGGSRAAASAHSRAADRHDAATHRPCNPDDSFKVHAPPTAICAAQIRLAVALVRQLSPPGAADGEIYDPSYPPACHASPGAHA